MVLVKNLRKDTVYFSIDTERARLVEFDDRTATKAQLSSIDEWAVKVAGEGHAAAAPLSKQGAGGGGSVSVDSKQAKSSDDEREEGHRKVFVLSPFLSGGYRPLPPGVEVEADVPGPADGFYVCVMVGGAILDENIYFNSAKTRVVEINDEVGVRRPTTNPTYRRRLVHADALNLELDAARGHFVGPREKRGAFYRGVLSKTPPRLWIRSADSPSSEIQNGSHVLLLNAPAPKNEKDPAVLYCFRNGEIWWDQLWASEKKYGKADRQRWLIRKGASESDKKGVPPGEENHLHYGDNVTLTNVEFGTRRLGRKGNDLHADTAEVFWIVRE